MSLSINFRPKKLRQTQITPLMDRFLLDAQIGKELRQELIGVSGQGIHTLMGGKSWLPQRANIGEKGNAST